MINLSDIPNIIMNLPIVEREKLKMLIDNYNVLQKTKWFGRQHLNKEEVLKKYDAREFLKTLSGPEP